MWDEIEDVVIAIPELKLEKAFNPEIKIKDKYMGKEISIVHRGSGMQRYLIWFSNAWNLSSIIFVDKSDISTTYLLIKENGETKLRKLEGDKEIPEELGISPVTFFSLTALFL